MARERLKKGASLRKGRRNVVTDAFLAMSGCLIRKVDKNAAPGPDEVCVQMTVEILDEKLGIVRFGGVINLPE